MNKLVAIYNIWFDSVELLPYSLNCLVGHVDEVIFVIQDISNYGEQIEYELFSEGFLEKTFSNTVFTYVKYTPNLSLGGMVNETAKRNLGLQVARELGCTYFLSIDNDECFEDFGAAKKSYFDSGHAGSVSKMITYYKEPTLRLKNPESYYVPFIHKLNHDTILGKGAYPFYVDPTRKVNTKDVIELPHFMHHFSYVRKDINLKLRNSSASPNLNKNIKSILEDYNNCTGEGFYVRQFNEKLVKAENIFGIEI